MANQWPAQLKNAGKTPGGFIVSGGFDANGKRIKTIKATSRREAEKELAKMIAEFKKGQYIDQSRLSFTDFVERWIRDYAESNLAPKTLYRYKELLNSRILPAMGHLKIEQIKPTHLIEFYKNLQEDGIRADGKLGKLSVSTIAYHHRLCTLIP